MRLSSLFAMSCRIYQQFRRPDGRLMSLVTGISRENIFAPPAPMKNSTADLRSIPKTKSSIKRIGTGATGKNFKDESHSWIIGRESMVWGMSKDHYLFQAPLSFYSAQEWALAG